MNPKLARLLFAIPALVGGAFLVGPLTGLGHDLTPHHVLAHFVTGPAIVLASAVCLWSRGRARLTAAIILVLLGVWLASLPFVIPAPGLHVHAHVLAGVAVAASAIIGLAIGRGRPEHSRDEPAPVETRA